MSKSNKQRILNCLDFIVSTNSDPEDCTLCEGSGQDPDAPECAECAGTGERWWRRVEPIRTPTGWVYDTYSGVCLTCSGTGREAEPCPRCDGGGTL